MELKIPFMSHDISASNLQKNKNRNLYKMRISYKLYNKILIEPFDYQSSKDYQSGTDAIFSLHGINSLFLLNVLKVGL